MSQRENRDFNVRKVQWVGVSLVILLLVGGILLFYYQRVLTRNFRQTETAPATSPRDQLEFDSGRIRENLTSQQMKILNSYQWRNSEHSFAQVPIERAMSEMIRQKKSDPSLFGGRP